MFHEHVLGRARVAALRGLGEAEGPFAPVEVQLAVENASGFIELLRAHILKEDGILYPMAERLLTGPELDALETAFEGFEKTMRGDGSLDRFHALAEALSAPLPARPGAHGRGGSPARLPPEREEWACLSIRPLRRGVDGTRAGVLWAMLEILSL